MLVAGDTFRAAAIGQLKVWAERLGVPNRAVSLRSGDTSRRKLVEIQPCPLDAAAIRAALASE